MQKTVFLLFRIKREATVTNWQDQTDKQGPGSSLIRICFSGFVDIVWNKRKDVENKKQFANGPNFAYLYM